MRTFLKIHLSIIALLFSQSIFGQGTVKGYFPYYRSVAQANAVQYNKLTDVIYAFASLNTDGTLAIMTPSVFDAVQAKCVANGVRLHIAIGGWGLSGNFSGVAANSTYRDNLANACLSLCQAKGLAGIDIDWEFPSAGDKGNYTAMLKAIKTKLGTTYTLSAALGGEAAHSVGIEPAAFTYLDFFNIMSYDGPVGTYGNHASVQFMKDAMEIYKNAGCPYSKMVPGSAFYGRCGGEETYAGISASDPSGFYNDADGKYNNWCYDSKPTLDAKIDYAVGERGASGIMIWELSQDRNDQYSLLSAMKTKMDTYSCSLSDPDLNGTVSICGSGSTVLKAYSGTAPSNATYVWKNGSTIVGGNSNTYTATAAGTYSVTVTSGCSKTKSATVTSTIPAVNLGAAKEICSTPTVSLDAGISGNGFTYQWSLNSNVINNATSQTYAASEAGTYSVVVSATGCGSQSGSVAVTSSLVSINDVSRCGTGSVTMSINNPASGVTYDWYTAQTNGTKVNTGTTFTTSVSGTTTYYIDKISGSSSGTGTCAGVTIYDVNGSYPGGSVVNYNGTKYTAAYYANPNEFPGKTAGQWNNNGTCGGAASSCTRTPVKVTVTSGCGTAPAITFVNVAKTYGDPTFTMTATSNSQGAIAYSVASGTGASITPNGVVTITGSGTVTITANQDASGNYTASSATATLTIAKKVLTITANDASRVANTSNPAFTVSYSGFASNDNASSLATQAVAGTTATQSSAPGQYAITPSGASSNNYTFSYVNGTLTITSQAASPSISFANASKTYGDAAFTMTATSNSPGALSYSITSGSAATISSSGYVTITGAGTVTVTVNQAAAGNYTAGSETATITIAKKSLKVTANNVSRVYNTGNPSFTFTYTGFAGNDNEWSLASQPTATTTATTSSNVGTYPITVSGGTSGNYTLSYTNGILTVTGMAPTITFTNTNLAETGKIITLAATSNSSGVMSFSVANGTGSATLANGNKLTLKNIGTVVVTVNIAASGNYTSGSSTQTITISKATGIDDDIAFNSSINIFPNPVAEKLHITFNLQTYSLVSVDIIDIDGGNVVATAHNSFYAGAHEMNIVLPHLPSKIYLCKISHEGKTSISKISVKQ